MGCTGSGEKLRSSPKNTTPAGSRCHLRAWEWTRARARLPRNDHLPGSCTGAAAQHHRVRSRGQMPDRDRHSRGASRQRSILQQGAYQPPQRVVEQNCGVGERSRGSDADGHSITRRVGIERADAHGGDFSAAIALGAGDGALQPNAPAPDDDIAFEELIFDLNGIEQLLLGTADGDVHRTEHRTRLQYGFLEDPYAPAPTAVSMVNAAGGALDGEICYIRGALRDDHRNCTIGLWERLQAHGRRAQRCCTRVDNRDREGPDLVDTPFVLDQYAAALLTDGAELICPFLHATAVEIYPWLLRAVAVLDGQLLRKLTLQLEFELIAVERTRRLWTQHDEIAVWSRADDIPRIGTGAQTPSTATLQMERGQLHRYGAVLRDRPTQGQLQERHSAGREHLHRYQIPRQGRIFLAGAHQRIGHERIAGAALAIGEAVAHGEAQRIALLPTRRRREQRPELEGTGAGLSGAAVRVPNQFAAEGRQHRECSRRIRGTTSDEIPKDALPGARWRWDNVRNYLPLCAHNRCREALQRERSRSSAGDDHITCVAPPGDRGLQGRTQELAAALQRRRARRELYPHRITAEHHTVAEDLVVKGHHARCRRRHIRQVRADGEAARSNREG